VQLQETLKIIKGEVLVNITIYEDTKKRLEDIRKLILQGGKSVAFTASITTLEQKRLELANKVDITQEEIDRYSELKNQIESLKKEKTKHLDEITTIEQLQAPTISFPDLATQNTLSITDRIVAFLNEFININTPVIDVQWKEYQKKIIASNQDASSKIEEALSQITPEFELLKQKVEQNEQLQKLAQQITDETTKLHAVPIYFNTGSLKSRDKGN